MLQMRLARQQTTSFNSVILWQILSPWTKTPSLLTIPGVPKETERLTQSSKTRDWNRIWSSPSLPTIWQILANFTRIQYYHNDIFPVKVHFRNQLLWFLTFCSLPKMSKVETKAKNTYLLRIALFLTLFNFFEINHFCITNMVCCSVSYASPGISFSKINLNIHFQTQLLHWYCSLFGIIRLIVLA